MMVDITDLPLKFREANADQLAEAGVDNRLLMPADAPTKADKRSHKAMEDNLRGTLTMRGYVALTGEAVDKAPPNCPGFYGGHGHKPRKQALRPDQVIYDRLNRKPPLRIEFKTLPLKWEPGQQKLVELGFWHLCTSYEQAVTLLNKWEQGEPLNA